MDPVRLTEVVDRRELFDLKGIKLGIRTSPPGRRILPAWDRCQQCENGRDTPLTSLTGGSQNTIREKSRNSDEDHRFYWVFLSP
jgi:hypothetical protein